MPTNPVPPGRQACTNRKDGELFMDYVCDELATADKARFELHLCTCAACQAAIERYMAFEDMAEENMRMFIMYINKLCEDDCENGQPN